MCARVNILVCMCVSVLIYEYIQCTGYVTSPRVKCLVRSRTKMNVEILLDPGRALVLIILASDKIFCV